MTTIRAFIAFELPSDFIHDLLSVQKIIRDKFPSKQIRWIPEKNIHLSIKFLRNFNDLQMEETKDIFASIMDQKFASFRIAPKQITLFPDHNRPRGIWLSAGASQGLQDMTAAIEAEMSALGITMSRKFFVPHSTLARFRRGAKQSGIRKMHEFLSNTNFNLLQSVPLTSLVLYQSELFPDGARYTKRISANFE